LLLALQLLYGYLVQHFVGLAGARPPPLPHLNALTLALVAPAAEVPCYAATLARARLSCAQQRLAAALKDPG
jgi:nucleolar protein 14